MDIKIITVASEMTSNISKLNSNNFHPSIYMNSLRRHLSRFVIFSTTCAPKAILLPHSRTPSRKPLELFIFWIFMLCVVFFFHFFYIEPTIFCVRCAWQMAKSGEIAWLQFHMGITCLFACLFVCQESEQTKKEATIKATLTNCHSLHSIDTLEKQMGTFSACIRFHAH